VHGDFQGVFIMQKFNLSISEDGLTYLSPLPLSAQPLQWISKFGPMARLVAFLKERCHG
jgi:hypothetical protein